MSITIAELRTFLPAGTAITLDVAQDANDCYKAVQDMLSAFNAAVADFNSTAAAGNQITAISASQGAPLSIDDPDNPGTPITVRPDVYTVQLYSEITVSDVEVPRG